MEMAGALASMFQARRQTLKAVNSQFKGEAGTHQYSMVVAEFEAERLNVTLALKHAFGISNRDIDNVLPLIFSKMGQVLPYVPGGQLTASSKQTAEHFQQFKQKLPCRSMTGPGGEHPGVLLPLERVLSYVYADPVWLSTMCPTPTKDVDVDVVTIVWMFDAAKVQRKHNTRGSIAFANGRNTVLSTKAAWTIFLVLGKDSPEEIGPAAAEFWEEFHRWDNVTIPHPTDPGRKLRLENLLVVDMAACNSMGNFNSPTSAHSLFYCLATKHTWQSGRLVPMDYDVDLTLAVECLKQAKGVTPSQEQNYRNHWGGIGGYAYDGCELERKPVGPLHMNICLDGTMVTRFVTAFRQMHALDEFQKQMHSKDILMTFISVEGKSTDVTCMPKGNTERFMALGNTVFERGTEAMGLLRETRPQALKWLSVLLGIGNWMRKYNRNLVFGAYSRWQYVKHARLYLKLVISLFRNKSVTPKIAWMVWVQPFFNKQLEQRGLTIRGVSEESGEQLHYEDQIDPEKAGGRGELAERYERKLENRVHKPAFKKIHIQTPNAKGSVLATHNTIGRTGNWERYGGPSGTEKVQQHAWEKRVAEAAATRTGLLYQDKELQLPPGASNAMLVDSDSCYFPTSAEPLKSPDGILRLGLGDTLVYTVDTMNQTAAQLLHEVLAVVCAESPAEQLKFIDQVLGIEDRKLDADKHDTLFSQLAVYMPVADGCVAQLSPRTLLANVSERAVPRNNFLIVLPAMFGRTLLPPNVLKTLDVPPESDDETDSDAEGEGADPAGDAPNTVEKLREFAASMDDMVGVAVEDDSASEYGETAPPPSDYRKGCLQIISSNLRRTAWQNEVVKPGPEACCFSDDNSAFRMIYSARLMQFEQTRVIGSIQAAPVKTRISIEFEAVDNIWRQLSEDGNQAIYTIFCNSAPQLEVSTGARSWSGAPSDFTAPAGKGPRGSRGGTQTENSPFVVYRFATAAGPVSGSQLDAQDSVECRITRRLNAFDQRLRERLADTTKVEDAMPDAGLSRDRYAANVVTLDATPMEFPLICVGRTGAFKRP
jgi:hypothetical protein